MRKKNPSSSILLTGAGSGLGFALACAYAKPDRRLFLSGRDESKLQNTAETCQKLGAEVHVASVDVTEPGSVRDWVAYAGEAGSIDLVISNAGVLRSHNADGSFEPRETASLQIETNLQGTINLVTSVVPALQRQGYGHIALISSMSAVQPIPDMPAYAASKAGVNAYGEAIGAYLARDGIDVSVICPGFVRTPMAELYDSWRPFEISAEKAAQKIKHALDRKRAFYAFPLPLYLSSCMGRLLPVPLRRLSTKPFNFDRSST